MAVTESTTGESRFLALLTDDVRSLVEAATRTIEYAFGDVVTRQGDVADGLYEIVSGQARVVIEEEGGRELPVASLGPGGRTLAVGR